VKRGAPLRRTPMRSRRRRPPLSPVLRREVWERDEGLCQRCAGGVSLESCECHHRKLRSQGGQDTAQNLITLCSPCHGSVHDQPTRSQRQGFICPSTSDPASWPVHRYLTTWAQPTATGWVVPGPHNGSAA
jgi:hypothetical protein